MQVIDTEYNNFDSPFIVEGNTLVSNNNGILIENSDLLYHIQNNAIFGTGGTGSGIRLNNVDQSAVFGYPFQYSTIGAPGESNFIGNYGSGIRLSSSFQPNLHIQYNGIGIDSVGTHVPNGRGIQIDGSASESGSPDVGRISHNDIVFNNGDGILVQYNDRIVIEDNLIGANLGDGIQLDNVSEFHQIRGNTFVDNAGDGVSISAVGSGDNSSGVEITENNFLGIAPGSQPIDLRSDGPTANDLGDGDGLVEGPNRLLNFPVVIDAAVTLSNGVWNVPVEFDGPEEVNYRFEFYRYDDALKNYTFIRSETVDTVPEPGFGDISRSYTFSNGSELSAGDRIGVVAVQVGGTGAGDTSELSIFTLSATLDPPPTITDVILSGSDPGWTRDPYAFSSIVAAGEQLRPIATQGIDTLQIVFSEPVDITDGSELVLKRTRRDAVTGIPVNEALTLADEDFIFDYDEDSFTAKWSFTTPLADGKYAIHLSDSITDGTNRLDADWTNDMAGTPDIFADDPPKSFATDLGNGMAGSMGGEFRFHFALLAGDYDGDGIVELAETETGDGNGDGVVDSADTNVGTVGDMLPLRSLSGADFNDDEIVNSMDLAVWEANIGKRLATHSDGDADGDQDVDGNDYAIWELQYGMSGPNLAADFDEGGDVDGDDFLTWQQGLGLGYGVSGDASGDREVEGDDFLIWQFRDGDKSAWYVAPEIGVAALTVGSAPQVANVIISGSLSTHDPFSFDTVDGSGSQLATVPVGGADTISIVFSENVNVSADSLKVIGLTRGIRPTLAEFDYDSATFTATWRFENWTIYGDNYLISLSDAVADTDGNLLDGEWTNPASITTNNTLVSEFPSGDGTPGGNFNFVMTLLPGDYDLDGEVTSADFAILSANWSYTEIDQLFTDGDANGDGYVNNYDIAFSYANWSLNLQDLWVLADLDGDFDVDGTDLTVLNNNYGMTGAAYEDGDLNGDGVVDQGDLDLAFAQFGLRLDLVA